MLVRNKLIFNVFYVGLLMAYWYVMTNDGFDTIDNFIKITLYGLTYVVLVYFNLLFTLKIYFQKRNVIVFIALILSSFYLFHLIGLSIYNKILSPVELFNHINSDFKEHIRSSVAGFVVFILFYSLGASFILYKKWLTYENYIKKLEVERLKVQLQQIKNQINPHFLFNTLNNFYGLSLKKADNLPSLIVGLSELMNYHFNSINDEFVLLENEINYVKNLLMLERIRKPGAKIDFNCDKCTIATIRIPPLLFIPLIENAIKHGLSTEENGYLKIELESYVDQLILNVENSKPMIKSNIGIARTGTGLINFKKRLELTYPEKHEYIVEDNATTYKATLKINLK